VKVGFQHSSLFEIIDTLEKDNKKLYFTYLLGINLVLAGQGLMEIPPNYPNLISKLTILIIQLNSDICSYNQIQR
jgi:hypothetical protein